MPALSATEDQHSCTDRIVGADPNRRLDALFVNAPLRDYTLRPRVNDYTLPVLGMGYIATYAAQEGFNVGVLDAEAHGLGIAETIRTINLHQPRWVGMNLLAPTYQLSARIADGLAPAVKLMVGGHHAKAMPRQVLDDPRFRRLHALIIGEGETRVAALLEDDKRRSELPNVMWRDHLLGTHGVGICPREQAGLWTAPDINALPYVDRRFLPQDPHHADDGRVEANIVGSRGCPYDCGFCGAAVSQNSDISIRTRDPYNIIGELDELHDDHGATAFRFVDDLFLGAARIIQPAMAAFTREKIGERYVWDATGRINVLDHASDGVLDTLAANGLREVALGIESGSDRILKAMDKRITADMTLSVTRRLMERGIGVKGYFILGYPDEQPDDLAATLAHIRRLWDLDDHLPGGFRASVFEFRPYPGSPVWAQLVKAGHDPAAMMDYSDVDLTEHGANESMRQRDEFNFSVGIQFGGTPLPEVRRHLAALARQQHERTGVPA
ncbi:anaerobic magnesium-protoporphyrin IX monomethyl ester cyclase [Kitasatospora sp. MAP12-15]|uniref:B12-binding domain-containing radical SAM protein n=1 Tax=unclassified Kitasatospora TaxID=2633591 RepID=UPI002474EE8C|nr:radical SAM protein [Kitasatospora sp. MAP12-44]MDH6113302.1 anaerobic magnesium-protoporphyrin IX monomethyl ester cyclase [Kitasatospora sp. MAP12-44]